MSVIRRSERLHRRAFDLHERSAIMPTSAELPATGIARLRRCSTLGRATPLIAGNNRINGDRAVVRQPEVSPGAFILFRLKSQ